MEYVKENKAERSFDLGRFWGGRVTFVTLKTSRPGFTKRVDRKSLGMDVTSAKEVKDITESADTLHILPKEVKRAFDKLDRDARGALAGFAMEGFPFLPANIHPVKTESLPALYAVLDQHYTAFKDAVDELIADLPQIKQKQRSRYLAAAAVIWNSPKNAHLRERMGIEEFADHITGLLEQHFPDEREIRARYSFVVDELGGIAKSIDLRTRDEILGDEEMKLKLELHRDTQQELRKQLFEWVAQQAAWTRLEMFKALWPITERLNGGGLTVPLADKLRKRVGEIDRLDLFRHHSWGEIRDAVLSALDRAREGASNVDKVHAEILLEGAKYKLAASVQDDEFDASRFLGIMDDDQAGALFCDQEAVAEIRERYHAEVQKAVEELAAAENDPAEAIRAKHRLEVALGVQKAVEAAEKAKAEGMCGGDAHQAVQLAERVLRVAHEEAEEEEIAALKGEKIAAAEAAAEEMDLSRFSNLDLDEVSDEDAVPAEIQTHANLLIELD